MTAELDFIALVQQLGFPIFVVLWFMFRTEKILKSNTAALNKLNEVVEGLCKNAKR